MDTTHDVGFIDLSTSGGFLAQVPNATYICSCSFDAENLYLHNWTLDNEVLIGSDDDQEQLTIPSNAHLGLSYCSPSNGDFCVFQNLLRSVSDNLKFGLDLNMNISYATTQAVASVSGSFGSNSPEATPTPTPSTMQLGHFAPQYSPYVVFQKAGYPASSLEDFTLMTEDLQLICNSAIGATSTAPTAVPILSNFSVNTYPAVVDTGSVCLTLPQQFFDNLISWLDLDSTTTASSGTDGVLTVAEFSELLPVLQFQLSAVSNESGNTSTLNNYYIPLANLLISQEAFNAQVNTNNVSTPPAVPLFNPACSCVQQYALGIIRGASVYTTSNTAFSLPSIVLGTLALQGLYFAADMETGELGLANKYLVGSDESTSADAMSPYSPYFSIGRIDTLMSDGGRCAAPAYCGGSSSSSALQYLSNTCSAPECSEYFFTDRASATSTDCVVDPGYYNVGLVLLSLFVLMDILSYFTSQHSGISRCRTPLGVDETRTHYDTHNSYISYLLRARYFVSHRFEAAIITGVGKFSSLIVDSILVYVLGWVPPGALYSESSQMPPRGH